MLDRTSFPGYIRFVNRALCLLIFASPLLPQTVTATAAAKLEPGRKVENVRKINGRWWSDDNREMFPPATAGGLWIVEPKTPGRVFLHHNPADLERAEFLHLFMTRETVRQIMGDPNETIAKAGGAPDAYYYYAADGTRVVIRFMENDLLGDAKYESAGGPKDGRMVASVEHDLDGRTIQQVLQEQANLKPAARSDAPHQLLSRKPATETQTVAAIEPAKALQHPVSAEDWKKISAGMSRDEVVAQLGAPLSSMNDAGGEVLHYTLDAAGEANVTLEAGKVVRVTP